MNHNETLFSDVQTAFQPMLAVIEGFQNAIDINTSVFNNLREAFNPIVNQSQVLQLTTPNAIKLGEAFSKLSIAPTINFIDVLSPVTDQIANFSLACSVPSFALHDAQMGIKAMKPLSDVTINLSERLLEINTAFSSSQNVICDSIRENMISIQKMLSLFHTNISYLQMQSSFDFQFNSSVSNNVRTETDTIQPQAPPGIIETAIDNMKDNISDMYNSKTFKFVKRHTLTLIKSFIYKVITDYFFNL